MPIVNLRTLPMELIRNAELAPLTTFGVQARTEVLARFADVDQLLQLLKAPEVQGMPHMILGGGSNVLFTRDHPGAVLLNMIRGIEVVEESADHVIVKAGAGEVWHHLVVHCVERGWGGLENLSLIPGKVGAAPMQNIGAYGVELKDRFVSLNALRIEDGELVRFDANACAFGYRESFFKREGRGRFVILDVTLRLDKKAKLNTGYGAIKSELDRMGRTKPTIHDVSEAVCNIRRSKLPDPAVIGNAGSFFKNPVVSIEACAQLRKEHPELVAYAAPEGMKLAAGWLIERAGWKGYRANGHGVHAAQALVLVNHGGATGRALYELSERIQEDVLSKFGVQLEREVNIV